MERNETGRGGGGGEWNRAALDGTALFSASQPLHFRVGLTFGRKPYLQIVKCKNYGLSL